MRKEDILRKARRDRVDEREEQIKKKAFYIGWISVSIVMLILIVIRGIYNESANDIMMILFAQTSAISFYQYISIKEKKTYLLYGIISIFGFIFALVSLVLSYRI